MLWMRVLPPQDYVWLHELGYLNSIPASREKKEPKKKKVRGGSPPVLVHLDCYYKIPQTGSFINNKTIFLIILEAGCLRSWYQHGCFPMRASSQFIAMPSSCVLTRWMGQRISLELYNKGTDPIHEGSTTMILVSPNGSLF